MLLPSADAVDFNQITFAAPPESGFRSVVLRSLMMSAMALSRKAR